MPRGRRSTRASRGCGSRRPRPKRRRKRRRGWSCCVGASCGRSGAKPATPTGALRPKPSHWKNAWARRARRPNPRRLRSPRGGWRCGPPRTGGSTVREHWAGGGWGRRAGGARAAERMPDADGALAGERPAARTAESATISIARLRSQLEGLESLRPGTAPGLMRLGDVVTAEPGYERALSATIGPLPDALVAGDDDAAARAGVTTAPQLTLLFPMPTAP